MRQMILSAVLTSCTHNNSSLNESAGSYGDLYFGIGHFDEATGKVAVATRLGALLSKPRAEYPQMLDETWSSLAQHFYDPSMHGVDWL